MVLPRSYPSDCMLKFEDLKHQNPSYGIYKWLSGICERPFVHRESIHVLVCEAVSRVSVSILLCVHTVFDKLRNFFLKNPLS